VRADRWITTSRLAVDGGEPSSIDFPALDETTMAGLEFSKLAGVWRWTDVDFATARMMTVLEFRGGIARPLLVGLGQVVIVAFTIPFGTTRAMLGD
jgi:hypothetical protein